MDREYEVFELLPDGSPMWRTHVSGLHAGRIVLERLASTTENECYLYHLATKEVVARMNFRQSDLDEEKRNKS